METKSLWPNAGKSWNSEDIDAIKEAVANNSVDIDVLSKKLGRSPFGIAIKAAKFGHVVTQFAAELEVFFEKEAKKQAEADVRKKERTNAKLLLAEKDLGKTKSHLYRLLHAKGHSMTENEQMLFVSLSTDPQVHEILDKAIKSMAAKTATR